jgi:hypothetical protein
LLIQPYSLRLEVFVDDGTAFQRSEIGRQFSDFGDTPASGFSGWADVEDGDMVFRRFVIWLDEATVDVGVVAHECFHTATDVLAYTGVKDEEAHAYLLGWLTQMICDLIWDF